MDEPLPLPNLTIYLYLSSDKRIKNTSPSSTFNQSIDDSATATPPVESLVLDVLDDVAATVTSGAAKLASAALFQTLPHFFDDLILSGKVYRSSINL